jgi:hypothetical protein
MIATKDRADLCRRQYHGKRQVAPHRANLSAPTLGPVQRRKQERGLPGADGFAHLLKPCDSDTRPTCKANRIAAALRQQSLDAIAKPRW